MTAPPTLLTLYKCCPLYWGSVGNSKFQGASIGIIPLAIPPLAEHLGITLVHCQALFVAVFFSLAGSVLFYYQLFV